MIEVTNLSVSFPGNAVLSNLTFSVPDGGISVILGKNGSGKSVLLKAIAGLLPFSSGTVTVNGIPSGTSLYFQNKENEPTLIAYVFQKGGLFDSMTVFDNTAFGMRRKSLPEDYIREKVFSVLTRVGL
ncbi:MAG: ATP-binding cassette domain-containing protein, partial [Spirochaetota bacterium]